MGIKDSTNNTVFKGQYKEQWDQRTVQITMGSKDSTKNNGLKDSTKTMGLKDSTKNNGFKGQYKEQRV